MAKRNRNGNGTVLNLKDHHYPAAILNSQMVHPDPAHSWPGAPPEFGVVRPSHISTVAGWIGSQARTYPMEDEATRHSLQNCERMRRDPVIMECLKARQRAVALLPWSLQPEDESDPRQKQLVADLTSILERTYRFTEMRRYLMEAIWYGKSFVHLKYGVKPMRGRWRKVVAGWEPRHSDKILFRYSDGTKDYVAGQIGIRVNMHARDISREQLDATQYGLAYFLRDHERRVCICHKHEIEDGAYQDVFGTGRIHGVGVRDTVYWTWYASKEVEQKLLEYLDRTALGIEIWRYPSGNPEAEKAARKAATERIGGGRSIVLVPVIPGEQAELFGVQHIEPGPAGAELLKTICQEFYGHRIKRLIMGQVLTSEAEATGMGSGVAEAHLATFSDIIRYDAVNLEETLTEELVQIAKEENFPWARSIYIRMKLNTERPETEQKLSAYQQSWSMGLKIRSEDLYSLIGARRPDDEDDVLQNPNVMMAEQQMAIMQAQQGMPPPGAEQGDPNAQPGDPTQVAMGGTGPAVAALGAGAPPPGAPAEVSKDSAIEPAALAAGQTPDQQASPWAGFWDSLFAAARGQGIAPPSPTGAPGPVAQVPMPQGNGRPVPRVSREELMRVFQERFEQAIRVRGQTAGQFRDALEQALAQQPDGDQLATTMQFLFAWKTAEPVGKLKAAFQRAMDEPAADPGPSPLQQALEANVATQLDTRAALRDTLQQPAADPVKQAFQDAFTRQTTVREQLVQALRNAGLTPDGTPEPDEYGLMGDLAKKAVVAGGIGLAALGGGCSGPSCAPKDEPAASSGFTDSPSQNVSTRLGHAKARAAQMRSNSRLTSGADQYSSEQAGDLEPEQYAMSPESGESTTPEPVAFDPKTLSRNVLNRMDKHLRSKGYDSRGADDVLDALTNRSMMKDGKLWHEDWVAAYQHATGGEQAQRAKLQAKKTQQASLKNVNWERLKQLGTTTNYREAGYIAPEGHLIDLSGRRDGSGGGSRELDHREAGGTAGMQELMSAGHIRHMPEANGLDMMVRPTPKQYAHIRNIADRANGEVFLDLQDGLGEYDERNRWYNESPRRHNPQYPRGTRADRIIRDIETFYDGRDPPPPPEARYAAALAPEQAVERYETNQWTDAQLEAYALGRSHALAN
jgi:hypothetical protein